jgi:hypothetical protein
MAVLAVGLLAAEGSLWARGAVRRFLELLKVIQSQRRARLLLPLHHHLHHVYLQPLESEERVLRMLHPEIQARKHS